jgi:hypothetical protein
MSDKELLGFGLCPSNSILKNNVLENGFVSGLR